MNVLFSHPAYALLLPGIAVFWWLAPRANRKHLLIRSSLVILLLLALTQPTLLLRQSEQHQVIILDLSNSNSEDNRRRAIRYASNLVSHLKNNSPLTLIQLGKGEVLKLRENQNNHIIEQGSSLSDALALGLMSIPLGANGSVALISDGLATDNHWSQTLAHYKNRGVPVHTYQLSPQAQALYLAAIDIAPVRIGEAAKIRATVVGKAENLQIVVYDKHQRVAQSETFSSEGTHSIELLYSPSEVGFKKLKVRLQAQNELVLPNSELSALLAVQEPRRALYLSERASNDKQNNAVQHLQSLVGPSFVIENKVAATLNSDESFEHYDLIIQNDLPAKNLATTVQHKMQQAVAQHGLGLFHSGAKAAFANGGYHESPLAALLPFQMQNKKEKKDPSVGLAIIIDTSGSMGGMRIELAKQLARVAVSRLQPHDKVGIVEFYGAKHWAVPMQSASNKIEFDRAIGRMKAIGGTVLYPAIQEAYYGIKNVQTRYKHILVITDAGVEDKNYETMLRRIAKDNINVSTILVGPGGQNQIMSNMANWGKGRFYSVSDEFSLVDLIFKDPSNQPLPTYQTGQYALQHEGNQIWWQGIDTTQIPAISGFSQLPVKPGVQVLLKLTNSEDPVLASWQYGLGRVTALTSEPLGQGTQGWQQWPNYGKWLAQLFANTSKASQPYRLHLAQQHGHYTLSAQQLTQAADLPHANLVDWQGNSRKPDLNFHEKAPGYFVAKFKLPPSDDALIKFTGGHNAYYLGALAGADQTPEQQIKPTNRLELAKLAKATGGQVLGSTPAKQWPIGTAQNTNNWQVVSLWPYLLLLALMGYLFDIYYRRRAIFQYK